MRPVLRKVTMHGVGSNEEGPVSEAPPASTRRPIRMTCPPPAVASSAPPSRYSWVAPRRATVSMLAAPLPADDAPSSRRRPTLRMAELEVIDEVTLDASW
jgi:hypothetical protein